MLKMPEQDYRSVDELMTRIWIQVVSSECIVLQNRVDVELPGVGFNGLITGVGVRFPARSDCIGDIPGYVDSASEW